MGNTTSPTTNAQNFFTVIVSGRSVFVGSAFSIFLASLIAPFLADIMLEVIAMALSSKGFVHVALMANSGTVSFVNLTAPPMAKSQAANAGWNFVYHAYMPDSRDFRLLTDWINQNYTVLPGSASQSDRINMKDMRLGEQRVDKIVIQEFVGQRKCRAFNGESDLENDGAADQYILGSWQQSNNVVHTAFSSHEATARDKILIEFTGWQGILFVSLFVVPAITAMVLQPSMGSLVVHILCSNSLLSTSVRSKSWYTKTGFFVRQNAQSDRFVSCEENSASDKPLTFKEATRSCRESEKLSGYNAVSTVDGAQTNDLLRRN
ncbi:hypothetical protein HDU78_006084 [Chytriomyces hyalinus]|nr:hypothetical protein HDU78_006084 [Chytriomyces hyalinus]